jgi:hypothetical protein
MISLKGLRNLLAVTLITLTMSAAAQTSQPTQGLPDDSSLNWSSDGTRDKLALAAQLILGKESGFYIALGPDQTNPDLIITQFEYAFKGRAAPEITLSSGRHLFAGSVPESVTEKAMIITDADRSTVRAIAMYHASCGGGLRRFDQKHKKWTSCPVRPVLTFFVRASDKIDADVKKEAVDWTADVTKAWNRKVDKVKVDRDSMYIHSFGVKTKHLSNKPF